VPLNKKCFESKVSFAFKLHPNWRIFHMRKAMLLLAVFGCVSLLWAADPFVGTWKMNAAKSNTTFKSFTMTTEAQGNGIKWVQDMVVADGKAVHRSGAGKYDGKDYPVVGDPTVDTVSVIKTNQNTVKYIFKKNGEEVDNGQAVVSKDGKTVTDVGGGGKDANGQAFTYSLFAEKQ
jgi:hypothetical protein